MRNSQLGTIMSESGRDSDDDDYDDDGVHCELLNWALKFSYLLTYLKCGLKCGFGGEWKRSAGYTK